MVIFILLAVRVMLRLEFIKSQICNVSLVYNVAKFIKDRQSPKPPLSFIFVLFQRFL